jgi:ABC-type multidrug transport system permease subunit
VNLLAATLALTRKDLKLYSRDRTGVALGFLMPLGLVAVFGAMMVRGSGESAMPRVQVAYVDLDGTPASAALLAALQGSDTVRVVLPDEGETWTADDVREWVLDGDEPMALIVPAGFADGAELRLLQDPDREVERQLVDIALVQAIVEAQGPDAGWAMSRRMLIKAGVPVEWTDRVRGLTDGFRDGIEALFEEAAALGLLGDDDEPDGGDGSADVVGAAGAAAGEAGAGGTAGADADGEADGDADGDGDGDADAADGQEDGGLDIGSVLTALLPVQREALRPEGRQARVTYQVSHAVSGMGVMMLMFSLVGFGRSLLEERDRGALRRLLAAPIDSRAILLSKFLGTFLIGLLLLAVLFGFAAVAFGLDLLSRLDTLVVVSLATAAACTSFAMLVAAWARTDKQADGVSTLAILLMASIGGCWMPLMYMPDLVQTLARFTLPFWSLSGYQGTFWYGKHWTAPDMLANLGVLLGIAVALTAAAVALFRRRYLAG